MRVSQRRMWTPVVAIGAATAVALVLALLGEGRWDWLSAFLLSVSVVVGAWFGVKRSTATRR